MPSMYRDRLLQSTQHVTNEQKAMHFLLEHVQLLFDQYSQRKDEHD